MEEWFEEEEKGFVFTSYIHILVFRNTQHFETAKTGLTMHIQRHMQDRYIHICTCVCMAVDVAMLFQYV